MPRRTREPLHCRNALARSRDGCGAGRTHEIALNIDGQERGVCRIRSGVPGSHRSAFLALVVDKKLRELLLQGADLGQITNLNVVVRWVL